MFRVFFIFCMIIAFPAIAADLQTLEQEIISFAQRNPDQAYDKFIKEIENGANIEEQAIYLYGMGVAHEKLGNIGGAVNDYLSAEVLGYERAAKALKRLDAN